MQCTRIVIIALSALLLLVSTIPSASAAGEPVAVNACMSGGSTITVFGDTVVECLGGGSPPSPNGLVTCLVLAQPPTGCL